MLYSQEKAKQDRVLSQLMEITEVIQHTIIHDIFYH